MDVTLEQARAFVAVADLGHFGRAATRLSLTQPPVSRAVQKLESVVGVRLFDRTPRGVVLTAAGEAFLPHARRLLSGATDAVESARAAAGGRRGRVRLGFTVLAGLSVLGGWLAVLRETLPDVEIDLQEMDSAAQARALGAGDLDVGLVRGLPRGSPLRSVRVRSEELVAAVPAAWPLGRRSVTTLSALGELPLVMHSPDLAPYLHRSVSAAFASAGVEPQVVATANQVHTQLALVDAGVGFSVVPAGARRLQLPDVRYLDLVEGDGYRPADHLAHLYRAHRPEPHPVRDAVLDVVAPVV